MRTRSIHKAALTDAVTPLEESGRRLAYKAATEGIVLLENDGCLPLKNKKIALYGAGAKKTIKGGTDQEKSMDVSRYLFWKGWNRPDALLQRCGGLKIMTDSLTKANRNIQKNSGRN